MTGDQIITLCLGIGNLLVSILVVVLSTTLFNKREKIYLKRQEVVHDALNFVDNYLSWLKFYTDNKLDPIAIRDLSYNTSKMTIEARKIYNTLVCYCKNQEVVEMFLAIVFDECNTIENFYKFRNLCREELGLNAINKLNKERIFLSRVSTDDLEIHTNM